MIDPSSFFDIKKGRYGSTLELQYKGPGVLTNDEAWLLSLAKWDRIVEFKEENPDTRLYCGGTSTCGLCHLHFKISNCNSCPIAKHTGYECCLDTPYIAYSKYYELEDAKAELAFLKEAYKEWKKNRD